jgi:outer membrane protein TolC
MRWYQLHVCCFELCLLASGSAVAQQNPASPPSAPHPRLTLQDALAMARRNNVTYQGAVTDAAIAHEDKKQAIAALLPSANYNTSEIYTQGTGVNHSIIFIANNAVHEYVSQGDVHESIDAAAIADARRSAAAAAAARARAEIASRGLVVTVVQSYFAAEAAENKLQAAQRAADEGDRFLKLTQELEHGGEVAHSDVIKAELQVNDRRRQLQEAQLGRLNAWLDLSVLIFKDFNDTFDLADDLHAQAPLPALSEFQAQAAQRNPDVRAALEVAKAANLGVFAARAQYFPSLSFDYFYGIDATRFATRVDGVNTLGSSIVGTISIPVWNWLATQSKVKQAELQRDQSKRELSLAQRKLLAEMQSLYQEAATASAELTSLQQSAELGADSLRLTTLRYRNGESTVLEVVDAQNTATQSDMAYQDGAVRYRVALANLQTLTGVLTNP